MLVDESSFLPFKAHNAQVVRHAIRSERHYAVSGDMFAAGTALRYALEEFLHEFVRSESRVEDIEEGERGLAKLIDNYWAPRDGIESMHEIRMLGNRAAHTGEKEPLPNEILDALRSFWGILKNYFGSETSLQSGYIAPVRRARLVAQPAPVGRNGETLRELEQRIEALTQERRSQEDQLAVLKNKEEGNQRRLEEAEHDLRDLQDQLAAAQQDSAQVQALRIKVAGLARERDELANQRDGLALQSMEDSKARKELDDRLVAAERELSELLNVREWTAEFPHEDWSLVDSFILDRLEKGITPFQEWHAKPLLIGEGGFGRVYRCYPSSDGVPVAVKIPSGKRRDPAGLRKAWQGECRSARRVAARFASKTSLTVPKPLQIAPEGIDAFVVYEFVEGLELGEAIERSSGVKEQQRLSTHQALFIVDHLAGTVDQLLQLGVRHTDLQPRNVILRNSHEPVLIDYAPCLPGDRRPPEWRGKDPQECDTGVVESGQIHLLAILLVQLLGVEPHLQDGLSGSIPFLDADLEPAVPKDVREENLTADLQKRLEILEAETRDEVIKLILDALDEDDEPRKGMGIPAFRRILRAAYDPSGLIGAIWKQA